MSNINDIVSAESPRDVILFIVRNQSISYPMLDRLYNRNDWVNIGNNIELLKLVHSMRLEGLIDNSDGGIKKGPDWKAPAFMIEKKIRKRDEAGADLFYEREGGFIFR